MTRYLNRSGKSGVVAYEIAADSITVKFVGGDRYLYSYRRPGKAAVEEMKKLASSGLGLSTYISTHVREEYEKKF